MKYWLLSFLITLLTFKLSAQNINFDLMSPQPMIQEVYDGSVHIVDLNSDGFNDIIQSGQGEDLSGASARPIVFLNDGTGQFIEKEQNFENYFTLEKIYSADFDSDGDVDILITAINRADLYINDGNANFTLDDSNNLEPTDFGNVIIGDIDGDGDEDVVQFGREMSNKLFNVLHINDGTGSFQSMKNVVFQNLAFSQIAFIDLEGDGDLDVVSSGKDEADVTQTIFYENDGSGQFTQLSSNGIEPFSADQFSVGDIDNDGDEDLLFSGFSDQAMTQTLLYLNDGTGLFEEKTDTPFPDVFAGNNGMFDFDDDGDLDVLIMGSGQFGIPDIYTIIFENKGGNDFIAADTLGGEYIPSFAIGDLDGDGKEDLIIQGFVDDTNVYMNQSTISSNKEIAFIDISVIPNPSSGDVHISMGNKGFESIVVYNAVGQMVYSDRLNVNDQSFFLNMELAEGMYTLLLSGPQLKAVQHLVIQK